MCIFNELLGEIASEQNDKFCVNSEQLSKISSGETFEAITSRSRKNSLRDLVSFRWDRLINDSQHQALESREMQPGCV
jgi:hypothetical protein